MPRLLAAACLSLAAIAACAKPESAPPADTAPPAATVGTAAGMRFTAPMDGAEVQGPKVRFEVEVSDFTLVDAGTPLAPGEGHLHFFIDTPPDAVPEGQLIPLDSATKYVHAGKPPYLSRELELAQGEHTIWVVAANSGHLALREPAPAKVTVRVR